MSLYVVYCPIHKGRLRRYGDVTQDAVTNADLRAYQERVRRRVESNRDRPVWTHLTRERRPPRDPAGRARPQARWLPLHLPAAALRDYVLNRTIVSAHDRRRPQHHAQGLVSELGLREGGRIRAARSEALLQHLGHGVAGTSFVVDRLRSHPRAPVSARGGSAT